MKDLGGSRAKLTGRCAAALTTTALLGCALFRPLPLSAASPSTPAAAVAAAPPAVEAPPVMLGIDVLEAEGFAALRGKRVALLTHPAGVDRHGVSTIEILRRAPGVQLVALFSPEHGLYGEAMAGANTKDYRDARTGLMVYSLHNGIDLTHRPNRGQLKGVDVFVVDLQDIGTRSYTFISAMKTAMEGCFLNKVEFVVLDRPNPLGGLKVSGPPLDASLISYVGEFRVPYVHGLTMGELARMAKDAPGVLAIPDAARAQGKLTIIPMRGWRRTMRWPETGLKWIPTSQFIPDFAAVEGYPMTGLANQVAGTFTTGVGTAYNFRGLSYHGVRAEALEKELQALKLPGIDFHKVSAPSARTGQPGTGLYVEISDWDAWDPTELNFYLMRLACKYAGRNSYAAVPKTDIFLKLLGSTTFFNDLVAHGAKIDIEAYLRDWRARAAVYQSESKKYWLYP